MKNDTLRMPVINEAKKELVQILIYRSDFINVWQTLEQAQTIEELHPILTIETYNSSDNYFFPEFLDFENEKIDTGKFTLGQLKTLIKRRLFNDSTLKIAIEFVLANYEPEDQFYQDITSCKAFEMYGFKK